MQPDRGTAIAPGSSLFQSRSAERLSKALENFETYWRDYDFNDFEDLRGLRATLLDFVLEAHAAIVELEAK